MKSENLTKTKELKNKNNPIKLVIFLIFFFLNILHLWFALESCWSSSKVFVNKVSLEDSHAFFVSMLP